MPVHYKKYIFKLNEYFGPVGKTRMEKADIHVYFQQKKLIHQHRFTIHREVLTLCIDLQKDEETLRKEMNRTTRYQINRGKRDELTIKCISHPTDKDIVVFKEFFDVFAKEKRIDVCKIERLRSLAKNNELVISYVYHKDGRKIASHAYISNNKRATMLYSCSGRFVNSDIPGLNISRANRFLHWQDILYFKKQGFDTYDFLGLSIDPEDIDQQNINKFKKGFGGEEVIEYHSIVPQNMKGILLSLLLKFKLRGQLEVIRNNYYPVTNYLKEGSQ